MLMRLTTCFLVIFFMFTPFHNCYKNELNNSFKKVIKLHKKESVIAFFFNDINQSVKLKKVFRPCLWT